MFKSTQQNQDQTQSQIQNQQQVQSRSKSGLPSNVHVSPVGVTIALVVFIAGILGAALMDKIVSDAGIG
ncbi:MAG: hypothetical protein IMZ62_17865, partial [Chloroflexi bacterium]|nr:hypothetical protein [Chloroflexota bacterium]